MTTPLHLLRRTEQAGRRMVVVLLVIAVTHRYRECAGVAPRLGGPAFSEIRDLYGSLLIPQDQSKQQLRSATRRRESHR